MNVLLGKNENIQNRVKLKRMPVNCVPISTRLSHKNILDERPLKLNSSNLAFQGLSFKPMVDKSKKIIDFDIKETLKAAEKHLGPSAKELFNDICITHKNNRLVKNMVHIDGNNVQFFKKSVFHLIWDGIIYPIAILPMDIINSIFSGLQKIKPLKKWASGIYEKKFLKDARQRSKMESKINALRGIFETIHKAKGKKDKELSAKLFEHSVKMFDLKTGNYDTKHERSLNRIVSGSIPAFFLANDAYNLSMMCSNDKTTANKEQKTRFRQEVSRVGLNAYIQLITLGAIQKYINSSPAGVMLNTAITTLFTESFARVANGKYITRLTPEQAKAINAKNNNINVGNKLENKHSVSVENQKELNLKGEEKTKHKSGDKKPLLSLNTLLKLSAASLAICYAFKGANKIESLNKMFKSITEPIQNLYKKITIDSNNRISQEEFNKIIKNLDAAGHSVLAKKYGEIAKTLTENGYIKLAKQEKPIKPFLDFVIAPFKFILTTLKLPYTISERIIGAITNKSAKNASQDLTEKEIADINTKAFKISIKKLKDASEKLTSNEFNNFVNDNLLKGFNLDNMSSLSNKDLGNLAKTSATAATLWFLMTDNYNMVMLKSNGEDKEGAELKFKERLVQETSRLFYQTLLIDLFNSTFSAQYHNSLVGMSVITAVNTYLGEILNRKSVGMPIRAHNKQELIDIEQKKENATGLVKGYYDFMSRLTGKKSLAERQAEKK